MPAATENTASTLFPLAAILPSSAYGRLGENSHRGFAPETPTCIGPATFLSSTSRWESWQVYDGTASARLVGLDYFEARYFSSAQGRFTSPDPYNIIAEAENRDQFNAYISQPQNWNRYSYVWNNPLRHVDPTGETVYVIAYTYSNEHGDEEIKRAAETRANEIRNSKGFNSKTDTVLVGGVNSLAGFKDLVGKANGLEKQFGKVGELDLFSHAGAKDGPNFQEGLNGNRVPRPWSNEQNRSGVLGLNVNWAPNAQAGFYGCNTANPYTDFAQAFANKQNVPTYGINTDASFSVFKDWGTIGHALFRFGVNTQNLYMVPQARRDPQPKPKF